MRRHSDPHTRRALLFIAAGASLTSACSPTPPASKIQGHWIGVVRSGPRSLRLLFDFVSERHVTLVSLDEGEAACAATKIEASGDKVYLRFARIFASFRARLVGGRLVGTWRQSFKTLPLTLHRVETGQDGATG